VKGFLICGNHRFAVKEWVRKNNPELFLKEPYWNLTLTQIFISLSPDKARFLAKVDNEKERVQASDTMSSEIKVRLFIHQLLAIGINFAIGINILHLSLTFILCLQNLRKAFLSLTSELCPVHNEKAMAKALKKVKEQHSDATMDDAKDYFVMLSLDKKIVQFMEKAR